MDRISAACPECNQALTITFGTDGKGIVPLHGPKRACRIGGQEIFASHQAGLNPGAGEAIRSELERAEEQERQARAAAESRGPQRKRPPGWGRVRVRAHAAAILAAVAMSDGPGYYENHPRRQPTGHRRFPIPR